MNPRNKDENENDPSLLRESPPCLVVVIVSIMGGSVVGCRSSVGSCVFPIHAPLAASACRHLGLSSCPSLDVSPPSYVVPAVVVVPSC